MSRYLPIYNNGHEQRLILCVTHEMQGQASY